MVYVEGKLAQIEIKYQQNNKAIDEIMGITTGMVTLEPDDPEGWFNVSKIVIDLPYLISSLEAVENSSPKPVDPLLEAPFKEAILESLKYLNRLVEVIRYTIHRYWMRYLSEAQIRLFEIILTPDEGKGKQYFNWSPAGNRPSFPIPVLEESPLRPTIDELLLNDKAFLTSETLYLDALQYFSYSRFNESVIYANIALEVFIEEDLRGKYVAAGNNIETASKKVSKLFSKHYSNGGLRSLVKEVYFQDTDPKQDEILQKLEYSRIKRKNCIHPFTTRIPEDEARIVLTNVYEITTWIRKSTESTLQS